MTSLNIETLSSTEKKAVVTPDPQTIESTATHNGRKQISREAVVSWLFLIGSLMFVLDAVLENTRGVSFSSLLHLLASILFTIGSILFIPNDSQA
ncbi:hypothetical protein [Leptolyngbya sp. Heron Island J]|uniref:hypothetical protein n=1 Tax=Leptolyngbya sp. Heron Island J TaxID=1385935 RepID=UPI00042547C5|nr:hypothetical protein [Leptolyngbya sp. Heron Island J]